MQQFINDLDLSIKVWKKISQILGKYEEPFVKDFLNETNSKLNLKINDKDEKDKGGNFMERMAKKALYASKDITRRILGKSENGSIIDDIKELKEELDKSGRSTNDISGLMDNIGKTQMEYALNQEKEAANKSISFNINTEYLESKINDYFQNFKEEKEKLGIFITEKEQHELEKHAFRQFIDDYSQDRAKSIVKDLDLDVKNLSIKISPNGDKVDKYIVNLEIKEFKEGQDSTQVKEAIKEKMLNTYKYKDENFINKNINSEYYEEKVNDLSKRRNETKELENFKEGLKGELKNEYINSSKNAGEEKLNRIKAHINEAPDLHTFMQNNKDFQEKVIDKKIQNVDEAINSLFPSNDEKPKTRSESMIDGAEKIVNWFQLKELEGKEKHITKEEFKKDFEDHAKYKMSENELKVILAVYNKDPSNLTHEHKDMIKKGLVASLENPNIADKELKTMIKANLHGLKVDAVELNKDEKSMIKTKYDKGIDVHMLGQNAFKYAESDKYNNFSQYKQGENLRTITDMIKKSDLIEKQELEKLNPIKMKTTEQFKEEVEKARDKSPNGMITIEKPKENSTESAEKMEEVKVLNKVESKEKIESKEKVNIVNIKTKETQKEAQKPKVKKEPQQEVYMGR